MDVNICNPLRPIDRQEPREIRKLLGQFATGVTIMTTSSEQGRNVGMTANSFSSLSLDPPLILWSISKTAPSYVDFTQCQYFAVHMLAQEHHQLSAHFARGAEDKFAGVGYHMVEQGIPVLQDTLATLVCRNVKQYEGGDHTILIGEIELYHQTPRDPLLFYAGGYHVPVQHPAYCKEVS